MNQIKEQFKKWLKKRKSTKTLNESEQNSIRIYVTTIDRICKESFPLNSKLSSDQLWGRLTENIIQLTEKYYEFSNKEYLLDKITIWNALGYFKEITDDIYRNKTNLEDEVDGVSFYLYDGNDDLFCSNNFIASVQFKNLYHCLKLFNKIVFQKEEVETLYLNDEETNFLNGIKNISKKMGNKNLDFFALKIIYNKSGINIKKQALLKYCQYLYGSTKLPIYCLKTNTSLQKKLTRITKNNPKKTVDGNFEETRHLTGEHAAQVRFKPRENVPERPNSTHVLTHNDLALIFRIDKKSVYGLYDRFNPVYRKLYPQIRTILQEYYYVPFVNACLDEYHHYDPNNKETDVDYTKSDYKKRNSLWWSKKNAMTFVEIKKQAFDGHVRENCPYIDYAKGAPKYYFPYLEYIKETPKIRRIRFRKNNKNK